ncbi:probable serine/threonine-protein kinase DDB_G0278665 isoform X2 [Montipora foliosa]
MLTATQSTAASKRCGALQYRIYDPKNPERTLNCEDCPNCAPGMGVPVQCGSSVPNGTIIKCKECQLNKTFSKSNDSSMCKQCNECQKKIVLQQCTLTQDRKCGGCLPKHFFNPHLDDCIECYFCCPSIPGNEQMEQCKSLGLPRNEWCEATKGNKLCKRNLSKVKQTNTTGTTRPTAKSTTWTKWKFNLDNSGTTGISGGLNHSTNLTDYSENANYASRADQSENNYLPAWIATPSAVLLIVIVGALIYKKLFRRHSGPLQRNQEYATVEQGENVEMGELQTSLAHNSSGSDLGMASVSSTPNPSTTVSTASSFESVRVNGNDNNAVNNNMECLSQGENVEMGELQTSLAHNSSGSDLGMASVSSTPNPSTTVSTASSFESVRVNGNDNNAVNNNMECLSQANPAQQNVDLDIKRIPEDCVISDMEKLCMETEKGSIDVMKFQVQKKLDFRETPQRRTWHSVGLALQVDPEDLDLILNSTTQTDSPTDSILAYFKILGDREPKMRKFVQALIGCGREDLAGIICNWSYDDFQNTHHQAH